VQLLHLRAKQAWTHWWVDPKGYDREIRHGCVWIVVLSSLLALVVWLIGW
jgi:hypothetical protein